MNDLIAWLRACLDDDEKVAKDATRGPWTVHRQGLEAIVSPGVAMDREEGGVSIQDATHIARHDPAAVLEDIRMKRDLLDEYEAVAHLDTEDPEPEYAHGRAVGLGEAVKTIAAAYRHRPGFKESWGV